MTTPGNVTFNIAMYPTSWTTVLVIKAEPLYQKSSYGDFYVNSQLLPTTCQLMECPINLLTRSQMPSNRMPAKFMRVAAFSQPSEYRGALQGGNYIDKTVEQTIQCDISLVAYNYSGAFSVGNDFTFGNIAQIPLEDGLMSDESSITFNTSGLPVFVVSTLDLGALLSFFPSDSFSGTLLDGEEPMPDYAQGITAAMPNPDSRDIIGMFESMATSMTNQLRLESSNNSTARGLSAKSVIVIRVQWAWLILPFTVVISSIIFLIVVIICSQRTRGVRLWKSSSTALLFHSISQSGGTLDAKVSNPAELGKIVKTSKVKLEDDAAKTESQIRLLSRGASGAKAREGEAT